MKLVEQGRDSIALKNIMKNITKIITTVLSKRALSSTLVMILIR